MKLTDTSLSFGKHAYQHSYGSSYIKTVMWSRDSTISTSRTLAIIDNRSLNTLHGSLYLLISNQIMNTHTHIHKYLQIHEESTQLLYYNYYFLLLSFWFILAVFPNSIWTNPWNLVHSTLLSCCSYSATLSVSTCYQHTLNSLSSLLLWKHLRLLLCSADRLWSRQCLKQLLCRTLRVSGNECFFWEREINKNKKFISNAAKKRIF